MNLTDNLINSERKDELKQLATKKFEEIMKSLEKEKLNELDKVYLVLELCKPLARWQELEKSRLAEEALKKNK